MLPHFDASEMRFFSPEASSTPDEMTRGRMPKLLTVACIWMLLLVLAARPLQAGVRKVRVPDTLDDVVDDEEDEEWQAWGKPKPKPKPVFDPPPDFVEGMDLASYQREVMKRSTGPTMAFAKLRLGVRRDRGEAPLIAKKWTDLLKTGAMDARVVAVDGSTIMVTIPEGDDIFEVKDFVLSQEEAYEFKLGENVFRRPGDPPLDVVVENIKKEKERGDRSKVLDENVKEEL